MGSQKFGDPKGISIGSMDLDNPKVYGDTSTFDGLVISLFVINLHVFISVLKPLPSM